MAAVSVKRSIALSTLFTRISAAALINSPLPTTLIRVIPVNDNLRVYNVQGKLLLHLGLYYIQGRLLLIGKSHNGIDLGLVQTERSSRSFQPSTSIIKFQAIFASPKNRYFTENSRWVPLRPLATEKLEACSARSLLCATCGKSRVPCGHYKRGKKCK